MSRSTSTPLARERQLQILVELEEEGAVRVSSLAEQFQVAEETIRRDLDKLSVKGRLARTHGGAISIRNDRSDLPVTVRKTTNAAEKRHIAASAVLHVDPGDVIALDASTSVSELACLLPDMPLTVVTNGLEIVRLLARRPAIKVISTGGELDAKSMCFLGPVAEATIRQFEISKVFLSCKAIDLERGYSEASTAHASIKRLLIELAGCSYMLADHSKFGVRSMAYSSALGNMDVVITDAKVDTNTLDVLHAAGVATEIASAPVAFAT
ncbi:MAG: DeoR/GlpR transcriptional regulator [Planctomycetes bacterium]|nr:DeoR/GlpR transcriptional regulator [Planctomycetota bacterium]